MCALAYISMLIKDPTELSGDSKLAAYVSVKAFSVVNKCGNPIWCSKRIAIAED